MTLPEKMAIPDSQLFKKALSEQGWIRYQCSNI